MVSFFSQVTDINECSSSPCENGGTCSDAVNEYSCSCVAGYAGDNCETSKFSVMFHNVWDVRLMRMYRTTSFQLIMKICYATQWINFLQ